MGEVAEDVTAELDRQSRLSRVGSSQNYLERENYLERDAATRALVVEICQVASNPKDQVVAATHLAREYHLSGATPRWALGLGAILEAAIIKNAPKYSLNRDWLGSFSAEVQLRCAQAIGNVLDFGEASDAALDSAVDSVASLAASAMTFSDLIGLSLAEMRSVEGITSVAFVRPDDQGVLRYEFLDGDVLWEAYLRGSIPVVTVDATMPSGQGPAGRAWRSGKAQFSESIAGDPTMAPWASRYVEYGLRSTAAIPILDARGRSRAVLSLYSSWPAFFHQRRRQQAFAQIAALLGLGINRLGDGSLTEISLRRSFAADLSNGRLEMLFQPIVDLKTGELVKLEALARLRDEGGALVEPGRFIPTFGANELFNLFNQGLEQSIEALGLWREGGLNVGMAINVPSEAVLDRRYVDLVTRELDNGRLGRGQLTLELTEEQEIGDQASLIAAVRHLASLGVATSQDDLGAGYSSLMRLDQIAFSEVKIDQALVRKTSGPMRSLNLIYHLCQLVTDLGVSVVVEGLESQGLVEVAAILGAHRGQGYAISKPLFASEILPWHRNYRFTSQASAPVTPLGALALIYSSSREVSSAQWHFGPLWGQRANNALLSKLSAAQLGPRVDAGVEMMARAVASGEFGEAFYFASEHLSEVLLEMVIDESQP